MADRYWVGGTGTWDGTSTANWAASSGGASGASVPTAADNVFFDVNSNVGTGAFTVTMATSPRVCNNFTASGLDGVMTLAGSAIGLTISGSLSLPATNFTRTYTGTTTFNATTTGKTVTTNGIALAAATFDGVGGGWTLGSAFSCGSDAITVTNGTFDTSSAGNYSITCGTLSSSNSNTRTINLNASTVTCSSGGNALNIGIITNLTFNAGTSQISLSSSSGSLSSGGLTFYNVSFTNNTILTLTISGINTFNNLVFASRGANGIGVINFSADQTINGTLTLGSGNGRSGYRSFFASNTIGTPRTLTVNALASGTADIDFRDITIAGTAAPISGTRFGDCKGNSGITFPAAKTVYYVNTGSANWSASSATGSWAATSGGSADGTMFPLAQDTAVFSAATYPASGSITTIGSNYNIGTIDMSLRTSNTMTLSNSSTPTIYGNWINGTGITLSGSGRITFAGRTTQTITSAGQAFTQPFTIDVVSGSVTLQDALTSTVTTSFNLTSGTFDANIYNVALSGLVNISGTSTRTLALGSGTITIATSGTVWNATTTTNLTVTGTGTISLTNASAKTFAGGGIQTYPTINQGGAGALTITGSNKFANITNTYSATGATSVLFTAGTTNIFTAFNLTGAVGNVCTLGSTTTSQATLQKSSTWFMGANSTNGGNNTGLTFSAGGGIDYLSVSYINGTVVAPASGIGGNFLMFF